MARGKTDFDIVRKIGAELPDVRDNSSDRGVALKLHGKLMACKAINKSAEPNTLMVRIGVDERDRLIGMEPDTFYVTDHYLKHSSVLVRLGRISRKSLRSVLESSWRFMMEQG